MECPQCGHVNGEEDKFCSNCGARLTAGTSIPRQFVPPERADTPPPSAVPQATQPVEPRAEDPHDPEWRMSPLPEEAPPKRRTWLWVLGGIILFCVLLFCGFSIFLTTGPGQNLLDDLATRSAELITATP
ncbi:MAG TPA: zinc-ribbon domain-containing protein [Thermomicrobiales bacterium]|nr:zinc-ribbon domain-containing protein [Thermomicrobiales bacterium]